MKRGDVVIMPFRSRTDQAKNSPGNRRAERRRQRPAGQHDSGDGHGDLSDSGQPTNLLLDPATPTGQEWAQRPSLVKCGNLATVRQNRVLRVIGQLSDSQIQQLNKCLKAALELL